MIKGTREQAHLYREALARLDLIRSRYPMYVEFDIEGALEHILLKCDSGDVYLGHGCMLLVSQITPWFGKERVLQEELILRLGDEPPRVRSVIRWLAKLVEIRRCHYCLAGNTYQDPRLTRIYEHEGFSHLTDVLHKEAQWVKS